MQCISSKELAEVLGVSKDTVNSTVQKLELDGVLVEMIFVVIIMVVIYLMKHKLLQLKQRLQSIIILLAVRLTVLHQNLKKIK